MANSERGMNELRAYRDPFATLVRRSQNFALHHVRSVEEPPSRHVVVGRPSGDALARRVAEVVESTVTAQLVLVREDHPVRDTFETLDVDEGSLLRRTQSRLTLVSVVELLLCAVFLPLGVYGFDHSSYTPCPWFSQDDCVPRWESDGNGSLFWKICPTRRPDCPSGEPERLSTYPMTPSWAKFAYTTVMGRSLMVLIVLPSLGCYPDFGKRIRVFNAIFTAAFFLAALCMAWYDMKHRSFALFYQIPLTIMAAVSIASPTLLVSYMSHAKPSAPSTINALVITGGDRIEAMVVDDVRVASLSSATASS